MIKIQKLNEISPLIFDIFDDKYTVGKDIGNPDAVLVRSAVMHDYAIGGDLVAVARAGAGVNNIPLERMSEAGVAVFNTPGANANAVKELILTSLLLSNRNIVDGVNWTLTLKGNPDAAKLVESGKKKFVGPELFGKTIGIIGIGAIGILVAGAVSQLGMKAVAYDPYVGEQIKNNICKTVELTPSLDYLYSVSDYITLHVPLTDATRKMINADSIAKMKPHVRIINAARSELVDNAALIRALDQGMVAKYVTDFPNIETIGMHKNIIAIPHLGASTPEAEDNCAIMAAKQLKDFIERGNIVNSVNYPNLSMEKTGEFRITVISKENILQNVVSLLAQYTIKGTVSGSRSGYDYYIVDVDRKPERDVLATIAEHALKVRILG